VGCGWVWSHVYREGQEPEVKDGEKRKKGNLYHIPVGIVIGKADSLMTAEGNVKCEGLTSLDPGCAEVQLPSQVD
jgi:hypothetical protein